MSRGDFPESVSENGSIIAKELPDLEDNPEVATDQSKQEEMIQLLQYAADELGKSPTIQEFNALNLDVSADTIRNTFGTWNVAKEAAGLDTWQRRTVRNINETYFQSIDSSEKAYWFGALLATSSIDSHPNGQSYILLLSRIEDKAYFVTEFADAIDSDYSLQWNQSNKSDKQQVQLQISNPTFIEHLLNVGYPEPSDELAGFPATDKKYRPSFLRGFLESSGYFTTTGWNIGVANFKRGKMLQRWFKQYGAKQVTISQVSSGSIVVRVTNPFDIKVIFESLWPDILQTEPSWKPYPQKILQYLNSEYPYPENLSYLQG